MKKTHIIWLFVAISTMAMGSHAIGAALPIPEKKPAPAPPQISSQSFSRIKIIDKETSRGIPAVQLRLLNVGVYWTDNKGQIAFFEPDLVGHEVWATVESHGYVSDNAPMGFKGVVFRVTPGGNVVIPMRRINIAQRLYRMTGSGMYRDSILLGDKVPQMPEPDEIPTMGQDGCDTVRFKDKLFWLWGDTMIARFPLGVYQGTGAVSDPPDAGGLDPEEGIELRYMRKDNGELRPIINLPLQPGQPYWYSKPRVVKDARGVEHLLTDYTKVNAAMKPLERGLVEFSEETGYFEPLSVYDPEHPLFQTEGGGTTVFRYSTGNKEYFYHSGPYPSVRWPVDYESQADIASREAFTCLKEGSKFDGSADQLDRDDDGNLRWSWKKNTSPISEKEMDQMIKAGAMKPEERWYAVLDADSGKSVLSHQGSIYWNPFRKRWVCIRIQNFGETLVGEVIYLEGDTPQGPWVYSRKIVTHNWKDHTASYYVPAQIPYFDKENGRVIFFKGSFSSDFGDVRGAAPRYTYNSIVYKLELDDPRLFLPVPVYYDPQNDVYGTKEAFGATDSAEGLKSNLELGWFAPDRQAMGTVPVYQVKDGGGARLTMEPQGDAKPVFYAMAAGRSDAEGAGDAAASGADETVKILGGAEVTVRGTAKASDRPATHTALLREFVGPSGKRVYSTADSIEGHTVQGDPLCRVWINPIRFNPFGKPEGIW